MGRRAGGLEGGVVAVDRVEVDRVRVTVVLNDVEAQAAGLVLARAAPVLERALQDLVTVFRLHADRYEQRSHDKFSCGCGWGPARRWRYSPSPPSRNGECRIKAAISAR